MENETKTAPTETNQDEITCRGCGAKLTYEIGTDNLKCQSCGAENPIISGDTQVKENDFYVALSKLDDNAVKHTVTTVKCKGCGAESTFEPNIASDNCPYCGTQLILKEAISSETIQPEGVLPFDVDSKKAFQLFKKWISKLWWAPNELKKYAVKKDKLTGLYMPFWTFDSNTISDYTGQRGTNYTTTITVNGKTQTVTRISWSYASGTVNVNFDDVLSRATNSLNTKYLEKLEPWDLPNLKPFNHMYLSGFKTEKYQIGLKDGFENAKIKMSTEINSAIRRDIGGNHQRISSVSTQYNDISFKHILLPMWISSYLFNGRTFNIMINARTGEVQGERPYSWIKIVSAIVTVIALAVGGYFAYRYFSGN